MTLIQWYGIYYRQGLNPHHFLAVFRNETGQNTLMCPHWNITGILPHYFHMVPQMHFTKWLLKNAPKFNFCNNLRNLNLHIPNGDFLKINFLKSSRALTAILHLHLSAAMDSSIPGGVKWKSFVPIVSQAAWRMSGFH